MTKNGSECIKILLHYDHANVDAKDYLHRTPIMYAIINGIDSNTIGMINNFRNFLYELIDTIERNILFRYVAC
jgi:hypothetical protein